MRAVAVLLLCASLGCSSKTVAPPAPPAITLNPQALAKGETSSILWALSRPHQEMSSLFGPHQLTLSVLTKLSKDKEVAVSLQEDLLLGVDPNGVVHILSNNNQNQGFDAYVTKTSAAIATRFGPLQPAPIDAVQRARDTAFGVVYANLEPLSPWLVFTPKGDQEIAGVHGQLFQLGKKEAKAPPSASGDTSDKAWRATISPEDIAGELVLDPKSGFLLSADFSLRYTAIRNEQKILLEINVKATLNASGKAVAAIVVPEIDPLEPKLRVEKDRLDVIGKAALQQQKENKKKGAKPPAVVPPAGTVVTPPAGAVTLPAGTPPRPTTRPSSGGEGPD